MLLAGLASLLLMVGCGRLPTLDGRVDTQAPATIGDTALARAIAPLAAEHPGSSGVYPLADGRGAFAARYLLIEAAQRTLDVQYSLWHDDISGTLLLDALRRAADRGVRVRLLLDDNGIAGLDQVLAALDVRPEVEVRLYNPFVHRSLRMLGYLTDFRRLNRRMHNKSLTADGMATLVGGRNVGNEYFAAAPQVNFADLDLLAVGPVAADVEAVFDRYWNSRSSYPLALLVHADPEDAAALLETRTEELGGPQAVHDYAAALEKSTVVRDLLAGGLPFEWTAVHVVADDPAKTLAEADSDVESGVLSRLTAEIGDVSRRLDIVSPYFVPTASGTAGFAELAKRGVETRVLTNSLAATDVLAVHAGYAQQREALLHSGVRLFELKPQPSDVPVGGDLLHRLGSSSASLHAKTFAVDGRRVFVGSFVFDPRSAALNTEMGLVAESPALAAAIHEAFDTAIPRRAYEAQLDPDGQLEWFERDSRAGRLHSTEPDSTALHRAMVRALTWLPIERLL